MYKLSLSKYSIYDTITRGIIMLLSEMNDDAKYHAAVGVVFCRDKWLLGLADTSDDRNNRWVFPGGGIKRGETPAQAAVREVKEETGVKCKIASPEMLQCGNKNVAFFACRATNCDNSKIKYNHEYKTMAWFSEDEFSSIKLYKNVKQLIAAAKKVK